MNDNVSCGLEGEGLLQDYKGIDYDFSAKSQESKNIFLDLDNVLVVSNFVEIASKNAGMDLKEADITQWNFANFPENVRDLIFKCFNDPEIMCKNVKVIEGVADWIKKHSLNHNLYVITARNSAIHKETSAMIRNLFPQIKEIFYRHDKTNVMKEYSNVLFVDDGPTNIDDAMSNDIECVLISNKYTKYNHHLRPKVTWKKAVTEIEI